MSRAKWRSTARGRWSALGDFQAQAEQVFTNLRVALASVGASFRDVVKTTTFITDLKNLPALRETRARYFDATHPPANSLIPVTTLARPDLLLEIEAVVDLNGGDSGDGAWRFLRTAPGGPGFC